MMSNEKNFLEPDETDSNSPNLNYNQLKTYCQAEVDNVNLFVKETENRRSQSEDNKGKCVCVIIILIMTAFWCAFFIAISVKVYNDNAISKNDIISENDMNEINAENLDQDDDFNDLESEVDDLEDDGFIVHAIIAASIFVIGVCLSISVCCETQQIKQEEEKQESQEEVNESNVNDKAKKESQKEVNEPQEEINEPQEAQNEVNELSENADQVQQHETTNAAESTGQSSVESMPSSTNSNAQSSVESTGQSSVESMPSSTNSNAQSSAETNTKLLSVESMKANPVPCIIFCIIAIALIYYFFGRNDKDELNDEIEHDIEYEEEDFP